MGGEYGLKETDIPFLQGFQREDGQEVPKWLGCS